ncbi:HAMP domain-containing protein [Candidatus Poribacteria bacterium]|nr:HAMP domain-containing protein [Candidatus Poribacteria bacterium]
MRDSTKKFFSSSNTVLNKIFLPFVAVMVLIGALIIYTMIDLVSANVEARVNDKLKSDIRLTQEIVVDIEKSLAFYAQFMADTERLAGHISEARDSRLVIIYLLEFLRENKILSNIGGGSDLASVNPGLNRLGLLGIRATDLVARLEDGKKTLEFAAVAPIEGRAGSRSVITVSRPIDKEFLQDLRQKTGAYRVQVYYRGELVESSSGPDACDEEIRKIFTPKLLGHILNEDVPYFAEFDCGDHSVRMILSPLIVNFRKEALVAIFESVDDLSRAKRNIITTTVIVVGLTLLVIVPIFILTVSRTVGPIRELSRASAAVAEGDLDQYVPVRTGDEVGELSESFNKMVADLKKYREELERWNQTLEERVAERGRQLADAQAKLIQSTKLAAIGELAAGLAHELNNPLAGIYAFLQVLADAVRARGLKHLSDEEAESFEKNLVYVEREIRRCKSIIGSLLTFARVSEKNFALLDLNSIVRDTLGFMQSNLKKGNVEVETHFAEDLPPVKGDSNELQQVFLNIIVNARKAMSRGGKLIVGTSADKEDRLVRASVKDTGEGIKPEIMDKIFDPFFTTREPGEGTGLGLSISYGIIRDHGGEILVDSKVDEGSTFTVILPVASEEMAEGVPASSSAAPERN